jgi:hypothetical protein
MLKRVFVAAGALAGAVCLTAGMATAQTVSPEAHSITGSLPSWWPRWFPPVLNQALSIPAPGMTPVPGGTKPPATIPQSETDFDPTGLLGTYNQPGPTSTATNAFFLPLGTNGRTCFSCHQPVNGMGLSTAHLQTLFLTSFDKDPVFAAVDGANCPDKPHDHSLLLSKGVFRIFLPVRADADYTISVVSDPTGCNTNPTYAQGVDPTTGQPTRIVSVYRRPFVSTNLKFVTTLASGTTDPIDGSPLPVDPVTGKTSSGNIMWDGREISLRTQAINATLSHAQATTPPTATQVQQMVDFENGLYSAQLYDNLAGNLSANGGAGGPLNVFNLPLPTARPPAQAFTLYNAWNTTLGLGISAARRESIYRGMALFNTPRFAITNVAGIDNIPLNPPAPQPTLQVVIGKPNGGSCSTCHSVLNDGSDTFPAAQHDIGVGGTSTAFNGPAPSPDLPIFEVTCKSGSTTPYHGTSVRTNDLGMGLISGKCADIGRLTVPPLRGLASRAPYFSDGSAQTLDDVVNFYNKRFKIGLTAQEHADLVNFLNAL